MNISLVTPALNFGPARPALESDAAATLKRRLGRQLSSQPIASRRSTIHRALLVTCLHSFLPLLRYNRWKLRVVDRSAIAQQIDRSAVARQIDRRAAAQKEVAMHADRVELSWDSAKSKWLVRIQAGDEVIRRHSALPKDADEQALRSLAQKTVQDEGYEPVPAELTIRR